MGMDSRPYLLKEGRGGRKRERDVGGVRVPSPGRADHDPHRPGVGHCAGASLRALVESPEKQRDPSIAHRRDTQARLTGRPRQGSCIEPEEPGPNGASSRDVSAIPHA